jgi:hypothetical protein
MVDLSPTIVAKSDQLNADDLMGGPITVRVTRVTGNSDKEQPISVHYDGDGGKPYKPGKSMRRVLVNFWGKDGEAYVGRYLTLYRNPDVIFGGIKVGGIRISHMSHLDEDGEMALAVTKGAKRLYKVKPLQVPNGNGNGAPRKTPAEQVDAYVEALKGLTSLDALREYQLDERRAKWAAGIKEKHPELHERIVEANSRRSAELSPPSDGDEDDGEEGDDEITTGDGGAADDDGDDDQFPA